MGSMKNEFRRLLLSGENKTSIARKLGVTRQTVYNRYAKEPLWVRVFYTVKRLWISRY